MRALLLIGLALSLSGCPSPFGVNQLNRLPDSKPLPESVLINRPGPLLHEASGFEFAERYETFQRVSAYRYDTAGLDVGFGYNDRRPDCLIMATIYVYPTPRMSFVGASPEVVASMEQGWLDQEFAGTKVGIEHHHPEMHSAVEGHATTPIAGFLLRGRSLTFYEADSRSELRLFVYGHQWFLKYRFTYPQPCALEAGPRIETMIRLLPWAAVRSSGAYHRGQPPDAQPLGAWQMIAATV